MTIAHNSVIWGRPSLWQEAGSRRPRRRGFENGQKLMTEKKRDYEVGKTTRREVVIVQLVAQPTGGDLSVTKMVTDMLKDIEKKASLSTPQ